jgi:phosphoribosylanthranilate isomerase
MNVKIKICGMRDEENIREVSVLQPDYMGFIFYDKSPRYVGHDFKIPVAIPEEMKRVGVFVNHTEQFVKETMMDHQLMYAQLHGDESVLYCKELKEHGVKIIKVFRVDEDFDFGTTTQFESVADFFLFDTKGKLYGGNAIPFDWTLLNQYNQSVPFFLSGGIQSENILQLRNILSLNIHAVDLNSGIEDRPGFKNTGKISAIINQLHI